MNTLTETGIRLLDIELVKYFFRIKSSTIEELEEHASGMFSTQMKLQELERQLLSFILSYKNKNSIFFIFLNEEREQNLKIVVSNVQGEPDELTKRFTIVLDEGLIGLKISQLSVSSKILSLITSING
ncbi:MAG: hypothetical protein IMZ64_07580 [Bacteroidetes bacterium]|nr:hypothetical protein [Bacteroidota bacterium]